MLENWKDRLVKGPFSTKITEHQCWESGILKRYGFRPTHTFFTRRFDLARDLVPHSALERGFVILDMWRTKSHTFFC